MRPAALATTPSEWSSSSAMWWMKDRMNSTRGCTSITSAADTDQTVRTTLRPGANHTPVGSRKTRKSRCDWLQRPETSWVKRTLLPV